MPFALAEAGSAETQRTDKFRLARLEQGTASIVAYQTRKIWHHIGFDPKLKQMGFDPKLEKWVLTLFLTKIINARRCLLRRSEVMHAPGGRTI